MDFYANALSKLQLNLAPVAVDKSLPKTYLDGNLFECDRYVECDNNMTTRQHSQIIDRMLKVSLPQCSHSPIVCSFTQWFCVQYEGYCPANCHWCDFEQCVLKTVPTSMMPSGLPISLFVTNIIILQKYFFWKVLFLKITFFEKYFFWKLLFF